MKKWLLATAIAMGFLFVGVGTVSAQCGNPVQGPGYVINQAKKDPYVAQFIERGSSQDFNRTVTVEYRNDGYTITIRDSPKCNGNHPCYPFDFITFIVLDCNFDLVAIAQT